MGRSQLLLNRTRERLRARSQQKQEQRRNFASEYFRKQKDGEIESAPNTKTNQNGNAQPNQQEKNLGGQRQQQQQQQQQQQHYSGSSPRTSNQLNTIARQEIAALEKKVTSAASATPEYHQQEQQQQAYTGDAESQFSGYSTGTLPVVATTGSSDESEVDVSAVADALTLLSVAQRLRIPNHLATTLETFSTVSKETREDLVRKAIAVRQERERSADSPNHGLHRMNQPQSCNSSTTDDGHSSGLSATTNSAVSTSVSHVQSSVVPGSVSSSEPSTIFSSEISSLRPQFNHRPGQGPGTAGSMNNNSVPTMSSALRPRNHHQTPPTSPRFNGSSVSQRSQQQQQWRTQNGVMSPPYSNSPVANRSKSFDPEGSVAQVSRNSQYHMAQPYSNQSDSHDEMQSETSLSMYQQSDQEMSDPQWSSQGASAYSLPHQQRNGVIASRQSPLTLSSYSPAATPPRSPANQMRNPLNSSRSSTPPLPFNQQRHQTMNNSYRQAPNSIQSDRSPSPNLYQRPSPSPHFMNAPVPNLRSPSPARSRSPSNSRRSSSPGKSRRSLSPSRRSVSPSRRSSSPTRHSTASSPIYPRPIATKRSPSPTLRRPLPPPSRSTSSTDDYFSAGPTSRRSSTPPPHSVASSANSSSPTLLSVAMRRSSPSPTPPSNSVMSMRSGAPPYPNSPMSRRSPSPSPRYSGDSRASSSHQMMQSHPSNMRSPSPSNVNSNRTNRSSPSPQTIQSFPPQQQYQKMNHQRLGTSSNSGTSGYHTASRGGSYTQNPAQGVGSYGTLDSIRSEDETLSLVVSGTSYEEGDESTFDPASYNSFKSGPSPGTSYRETSVSSRDQSKMTSSYANESYTTGGDASKGATSSARETDNDTLDEDLDMWLESAMATQSMDKDESSKRNVSEKEKGGDGEDDLDAWLDDALNY